MRVEIRCVVLLSLTSLLLGCGAVAPCTTTTVVAALPVTATANSSTPAPANQQQFHMLATAKAPTGCAAPGFAAFLVPAWTSADPLHVQISSASADNGLATCKGTTDGPVFLTGVSGSGVNALTVTATLTCK